MAYRLAEPVDILLIGLGSIGSIYAYILEKVRHAIYILGPQPDFLSPAEQGSLPSRDQTSSSTPPQARHSIQTGSVAWTDGSLTAVPGLPWLSTEADGLQW